MAKILFSYEKNMPTVSILKEMFVQISKSYPISPVFLPVTQIRPKDIDESDVVVLIRPSDTLSQAVAKRASEAGATVVTSCDDDLLHYKPGQPWRLRGLRKTLARSDAVWSASRYILEQYVPLSAGKRACILDTVVGEEQITSPKKEPGNKLKIVYAANPGHAVMFDELIRPVFPALVKEFGDAVSFTFISVHPDLREFENEVEIRYIKGMPLQEYRAFMQKESFDVGLAPLFDNPFSRCKYINKYLEYSMMGVLGIYSNVLPYSSAIRNGITGLLADNTYDGWLAALRTAISDCFLREEIVRNAQTDLRENFNEEGIVTGIIESMPELVQERKKGKPCRSLKLSRLIYWAYRPLDWLYLACFYLRNEGIKGLRQRIKIHFRENAYLQKHE